MNQKAILAFLITAALLASCSQMHDNRDDCPYGLYVTYKYDYNLHRADMFADHVGAVTLYIYDEDGKLMRTIDEANTPEHAPLRDHGYRMHITDLPDGKYQLIALAGQTDYLSQMASDRAKFVRSDVAPGSRVSDLEVNLDHQPSRIDGVYTVEHGGLPLDTLWHGMSQWVEVSSLRPTYDTISLVRDTKKITVSLRELDDPTQMDIDDYDLRIVDRNARLLHDNSVDPSHTLVYTPHVAWNTEDKVYGLPARDDSPTAYIGHADFMTNRIMWYDDPADDGYLSITHKSTNTEVAAVNLPDMLSRLRRYEDNRYSPQEFLDRGYDYQLDFYLKGDKLKYINISISIFSWSIRIQFEEL